MYKVYFQFHPGMYQSNLGHSMIPQAAPMQYLPQMNPNYMPQQVLYNCMGINFDHLFKVMYWNPTQVNNNMMQLELQQLGLVRKSNFIIFFGTELGSKTFSIL